MDGWKLTVATARIYWICSKVEASKVIDIGCSKGIASILLARRGFEVVGVDFDEERIEYANADREKESPETQERLSFICGDIYDVDLPEHAFHTVIMGEFLEHQARPDKAITRAYELLVNNGKLIVTVPFGLFIHPDHKQTFYMASLYKLIYPYFVVSEVEIAGRYLYLLCRKRKAVLERQIDSIELTLVERAEQEFLQREVALTKELNARKKETEKFKAELAKEKGTVRVVLSSFSFQLGNMLIQAIRKPGRNTILLPYRLVRLSIMEFRKRKTMAAKGTVETKTVKGDIPGQEYSKQKNKATSNKYTEIRLAGVTLGPRTATIREKYIERFGVDKSRLGGYHETDWRRSEYISSLLPEAKSVLDIGIGNGAFLNLLISLNRFQRILGIDIRRHSKFTTLFESRLYQIMYASVTNLPFTDKCIDVVTCMEVLEHLDKQSFLAALHELRRVSHFLVVTVPYNEPEPMPSYHKLRFTDSDLLTYFPHGEFILLKKGTGNAWMAIVERL